MYGRGRKALADKYMESKHTKLQAARILGNAIKPFE